MKFGRMTTSCLFRANKEDVIWTSKFYDDEMSRYWFFGINRVAFALYANVS